MEDSQFNTLLQLIARQGDRMEEGFSAIGVRLGSIEMRLDSIETRLDAVEMRLDAVEAQLEELKASSRERFSGTIDIISGLADHIDEQISALVPNQSKHGVKKFNIPLKKLGRSNSPHT